MNFSQGTAHISSFGIYTFTVYITQLDFVVLGNNHENGLKEKVNISFHSGSHSRNNIDGYLDLCSVVGIIL